MNFKWEDLSEDELLKMAAEFEETEQEMKEFEQKNPPIEISKELDSKMMDMIKEFERIELNKTKSSKRRRYMRIAAIFFVCVLVGMTALTMNVDAFRIKLFDFITEDNNEYIDVNIVEKAELAPAIKKQFPKDWESVFYPIDIPKEYQLVEAKESLGIDLYFLSSQDKTSSISLEYMKNGEGDISINNENCQVGETLINNKEAIYTEHEEYTTIIWSDSGYKFILSVDKKRLKDCIKIAESVAYVKLK